MPKNVRFWRNVTLIGLAHAVAIVALVRWSRESDKTNAQSVVWMNGGAGDGGAFRSSSFGQVGAARSSVLCGQTTERSCLTVMLGEKGD